MNTNTPDGDIPEEIDTSSHEMLTGGEYVSSSSTVDKIINMAVVQARSIQHENGEKDLRFGSRKNSLYENILIGFEERGISVNPTDVKKAFEGCTVEFSETGNFDLTLLKENLNALFLEHLEFDEANEPEEIDEIIKTLLSKISTVETPEAVFKAAREIQKKLTIAFEEKDINLAPSTPIQKDIKEVKREIFDESDFGRIVANSYKKNPDGKYISNTEQLGFDLHCLINLSDRFHLNKLKPWISDELGEYGYASPPPPLVIKQETDRVRNLIGHIIGEDTTPTIH